MVRNISDLWEKQKATWRHENEHYFGLTPLEDWKDPVVVTEHLKKCAELFWNGKGTNEMKTLLAEGKCQNWDLMVPDSFELAYDNSGMVCLYATFQYERDKKNGTKETVVKRAPLVYLPCPNNLCWFLGESEYVLRVTAMPNFGLITRQGNTVQYQRVWKFDVNTGEFERMVEDLDPWESLTATNRAWIAGLAGVDEDKLTYEQFVETLKTKVPELDPQSVYRFRYTHVDEMFRLVAASKRFANPLMKVSVPINVVKMFTAQRIRQGGDDRAGSNNLVLSSNELFALENSRTVIYKSEFRTNFCFSDSDRFFDAFKTSTNKSAGKSRLLLDDVEVRDGKLWNLMETEPDHWESVSMHQAVLHPEWNVHRNVSVLSSSHFSVNDAAKRIMMTAKLRAQAVPTLGEADPLTHETPARVVFGDWKGFSYGDSIIISRSFARKLRSRKTRKIKIRDHETYQQLEAAYPLDEDGQRPLMHVADLQELMGTTMCNNYRNIKIVSLDREYITVSAELPFSVGDKLTNLHGSKGVVSLILEDELMPYLEKPIGDFPAGPFDIIISGLSVYRRKSLGQMFEAWAGAEGVDDVDNIKDAVDKYAKNIENFANNSFVFFDGVTTLKPCGVNMILRLDHDACGKQSHSYVKSNYAKMLKFGEMELLNLASRSLFHIMDELDVRSVSKHHNSLAQIREMQRTGIIHSEAANNLRFFNILRAAGFEFNLRNPQAEVANPELAKLQRLLTDEAIDFDDEEGGVYK